MVADRVHGGVKPARAEDALHDSLSWSAMEIARRVRAREISPVEVVDAHIDRIEAVNGMLNAVVADRFEAARAEARAAESVRDGGPLHGVPCTIKEFVGVAGMPQSGGIAFRREARAPGNSPITTRLEAAGAIVLGVTNAPEGGLWPETNNPVYGRTSNPWDVTRTSGGSSGGEGAIIAAGGSPFGIGSDTGGSIRIPSGFCGIAGHKPTGGIVPNTAHFPESPPLPLPAMVCGPMARRVEDLIAVMRIIAGPDGVDPYIPGPISLGDPASIDLREVTVYPALFGTPAIVAATERAADALVEAGAKRGELPRMPLPREGFELWAALMRQSGIRYEEIVSPNGKVALSKEIPRYLAGRGHHAGGVLAILALQRFGTVGVGRNGVAAAEHLINELEAALGPRGAILYPVYPRTAPRHRGMAFGNPFSTGCTTLFNATTFPVTVVRVGQDGAGMPIGLQIAARRHNDHLTLALGVELERALGGWTGPVEPRRGPGIARAFARRVRR
jgi:fatty acid amide hydrolase 2